MGYDLRRWLADRLPDAVSSGERLVALEIADLAHETTRLAYRADLLEIVVRRTGLSSSKQVGKVLGKLAANGIELRVPIKDAHGQPVTDKAGRTLFACAGHRTTFRIPTEAECPALKVPQQGDLSAAESSPAEETNESESSPRRETKSSPARETKAEKGPPPGAEWSPARGTLTTKTTKRTTTTPPRKRVSSTKKRTSSSEPKPNRHQVADDLTAAFWEHHGKGRAQPFIAVRQIVRTAIGNGVERDDLARALDRIAREGRAVSGATIDIALGALRKAPFQNPTDDNVYDEELI
ncbi:hypothetical protein IGX29_22645 [Streptomyces sp. H28]|uniref:hypothetical protein n=1 Tax=Streptomyces sp. H28 TaxID=2775865 RepID=UPI0017807921|nr:hypothetical protein [Streptomyces sp. H28]MBD9734559.1 hypothetical protein [Streptomyces sp. H28]